MATLTLITLLSMIVIAAAYYVKDYFSIRKTIYGDVKKTLKDPCAKCAMNDGTCTPKTFIFDWCDKKLHKKEYFITCHIPKKYI